MTFSLSLVIEMQPIAISAELVSIAISISSKDMQVSVQESGAHSSSDAIFWIRSM